MDGPVVNHDTTCPSLAESDVESHHISSPPSAAAAQDTPPSHEEPVEIPAEEKTAEPQATTADPTPKVITENIIHRTTNPFHPPIPQTVDAQGAKPAFHYYSVSPIHIDPSVYSYTSVTPPHSRARTCSVSSFTTVFGGSMMRRRTTFVGDGHIEEKHGSCCCCWS